MISQPNLACNNNKVQPSLIQNQHLQAQPFGGVVKSEFDLNNYYAFIQAQYHQAQQQQAQQQLMNMYQTQFSQNSQNKSNLYKQLNIQNNQLSGLAETPFLGNQCYNPQGIYSNDIQMTQTYNPNTLQTNGQQLAQYYANTKPAFDKQMYMLNNYQAISGLTNSNQLNIFGAYNKLGNNTQSDPQAVNLGMNINSQQNRSNHQNQRSPLPQSAYANQSPIYNQNPIRNANPQMQSPQTEASSLTHHSNSNNCLSIVKKIKKSCNNCQNCVKQEQVSLRKLPSYSSSQSSESTNPIFDSIEKKQSCKLSSKKSGSTKQKISDRSKISRLEETRAERWSFMKKFYNKQILINRIFIDLEDENYVIQPTQITEAIVKKEEESHEEINNKALNECSSSVVSQSVTLQNSPRIEKSTFKFSGYSSSQESSTSLESATHF